MVASEAEDDVQKNSPPATTATTTTTTTTTVTTENNEETAPSKRFYRMEVWGAMKPLFPQGSGLSRYVNRKIPLFPEAEQTAERLAETAEFKDAKNIKVNIDVAQESVKLQVLKANKTLFVAPSQKSDYLYAKIKLPSSLEEIPPIQQRRIVKMLAGEDTYEELGIDQTEPLDMVVVGCVAVSERGQRIGKGNGYVDLEIGILHSLGVITAKTVIATTVADEQVYKELPADLFQNYDFTVDLIVTPTRVIRVEPRPDPRSIGVQWGLLSSRRLDVVRVLKKLKERLEKEGQHIELKDEDTDVESFVKRRTRGNGSGGGGGGGGGGQQDRRRQQNRRRRSTRNSTADGQTDTKSGNERDGKREGTENGAGSGMTYYNNPRLPRRIRKPRLPKTERIPDSDEDEFDRYHNLPLPSQRKRRNRGGGRINLKPKFKYGGGDDDEPTYDKNRVKVTKEEAESRALKQQKHHLVDSVRIRVSNMFSVPFKELKEELRNRDCYPAKISQSRNGRCLLIYTRRENLEEQAQADELLQKLADMRITVLQKNSAEQKQIKLKFELQQKPPFDTMNLNSITSAAIREAKRVSDACEKLATAADNPDLHGLNVAELVTDLHAAALIVTRATKTAGNHTHTVLAEAKPTIEVESRIEDSKLVEHLHVVVSAGADARDAATKVELAAAAIPKAERTDATKDGNKAVANDGIKVEANDGIKVEANDEIKTEPTEPTKAEAMEPTKAEAIEPTKAEATDGAKVEKAVASVPKPLPSKEAVTAVNSAVQEAVRATAAVTFAIAKMYELVPSEQVTVTVTAVQELTRLFGHLLPEVSS